MYFLMATLLAVQLTPSAGPTTPPQVSLDSTGGCDGDSRRVDMHRVMFLENRTLVVDGAAGPLRLRLNGETFYSQEIGEHSGGRTYFSRIDTLVRPREDLDIELKFALVGGEVVLYWRETYQNRIYRQGLLSIEGRALFGDEQRGLRPLCEGRGGSYSVM